MNRRGERYDIIVIGAGHAGCEAALAAAHLGAVTLLLTMNPEKPAFMFCNPSIGGVAKGHLVREIDALGGVMGRLADHTGIQFRLLNRGKGPAVRALRAQIDKEKYSRAMAETLAEKDGLVLEQATVDEILVENGRVTGVRTGDGRTINAGAVILAAGTFLKALVHVGMENRPEGPGGDPSALELSRNLEGVGFQVGRLKTGTPARLARNSIDFDRLRPQPGDVDPTFFSHGTEMFHVKQVPCHITHTNAKTHEIIRGSLDRSPLFTGVIQGVGPRYCPSIEDKIVRFPDRETHQIFLEPEGRNSEIIYANGISTSLPKDVQEKFIATIPGLEKAEIVKAGYAIEYDFFPPTQLKPTLETKKVAGLFFAGQINGTSGYEEAAAQGLMAGINALLAIRGEQGLVLERSRAYIGVMIDDLVTRGTAEPYRMFTSRAEFRLLLRGDNADRRLMEIGAGLGLVGKQRIEAARESWDRVDREIGRLKKKTITLGEEKGPDHGRKTLFSLLKRPEFDYCKLMAESGEEPKLNKAEIETLEVGVKYDGYLRRQAGQVEKLLRMEKEELPADFRPWESAGFSREAAEKFEGIRPATVGQAARIPGITPADITVLLIRLEQYREGKRGRIDGRETDRRAAEAESGG
jgi:tRNA uridine 5-carboxymethylaminomethyl modification enzyme